MPLHYGGQWHQMLSKRRRGARHLIAARSVERSLDIATAILCGNGINAGAASNAASMA